MNKRGGIAVTSIKHKGAVQAANPLQKTGGIRALSLPSTQPHETRHTYIHLLYTDELRRVILYRLYIPTLGRQALDPLSDTNGDSVYSGNLVRVCSLFPGIIALGEIFRGVFSH